MIKKKKVEIPLLDEFQICNEFKIRGVVRVHTLKKYKGMKCSKDTWESLLKEANIL